MDYGTMIRYYVRVILWDDENERQLDIEEEVETELIYVEPCDNKAGYYDYEATKEEVLDDIKRKYWTRYDIVDMMIKEI